MKQSFQILEWHWSRSKIFNRFSRKNVANIQKLAKKICHGWQSLCHTTVLTVPEGNGVINCVQFLFEATSAFGKRFVALLMNEKNASITTSGH